MSWSLWGKKEELIPQDSGRDDLTRLRDELLRDIVWNLEEGTLRSSPLRKKSEEVMRDIEAAINGSEDQERIRAIIHGYLTELKMVVASYSSIRGRTVRLDGNSRFTEDERQMIAAPLGRIAQWLTEIPRKIDAWERSLSTRTDKPIPVATIRQMAKQLGIANDGIAHDAKELRRAVEDWKRAASNRAAGYRT